MSDDKMGNVKFFPAPPRPEQDPPTATDGIAFKVEGQERPRIKLVPFNEIQLKTERRDLVKNLVPRIGVTVIWGPPKSGKSFFTFDMVMHVSLGWEYRGRRVHPGPVVYGAFEGQSGISARVEAFRQISPLNMSAFWGKADISDRLPDVR